MNEEFAWQLIVKAHKSVAMIISLMPDLKANCSVEEYAQFRKALATVAADIGIEISGPLFKKFSALQARLEKTLADHGHL